MSSIIASAIEWAAPYVGTTLASITVMFMFLRTSWGGKVLDSTFKYYFDRKLATLKHEQDRILADVKHVYERNVEALRADLSHYSDRSRHSNEREYQALIAAWEGFIFAYSSTRSVAPTFTSLPDLEQMKESEIEDYLQSNGFDPASRRFIQNSQNKNKSYLRAHTSRKLHESQKAILDARDTLRKQSVFIPAEIEARFEEAISKLQNVWAEATVNFDWPDSNELSAAIEMLKSGEQMKGELRDIVRNRILRDARDAPGH